MTDTHTYQIEVQGQVDENEINTTTPIKIAVIRAENTTTRMTTLTDQSGLIGLIRFLQSRGIVLLSIISEQS